MKNILLLTTFILILSLLSVNVFADYAATCAGTFNAVYSNTNNCYSDLGYYGAVSSFSVYGDFPCPAHADYCEIESVSGMACVSTDNNGISDGLDVLSRIDGFPHGDTCLSSPSRDCSGFFFEEWTNGMDVSVIVDGGDTSRVAQNWDFYLRNDCSGSTMTECKNAELSVEYYECSCVENAYYDASAQQCKCDSGYEYFSSTNECKAPVLECSGYASSSTCEADSNCDWCYDDTCKDAGTCPSEPPPVPGCKSAGESCTGSYGTTTSAECCSTAKYCKSTNIYGGEDLSYKCSSTCAPDNYQAPDSSACCTGLNWYTTTADKDKGYCVDCALDTCEDVARSECSTSICPEGCKKSSVGPGETCGTLPPNCFNQGGSCCNVCESGPMPTYNSDCSAGQSCCTECFGECSLSKADSTTTNSCSGDTLAIDMCGSTFKCSAVTANSDRWYLIKGGLGQNIKISFDNPNCKDCAGFTDMDLEIYVGDECSETDRGLFEGACGSLSGSGGAYTFTQTSYPCVPDISKGNGYRLRTIGDGYLIWNNFQGEALLKVDNNCGKSCPYGLSIKPVTKPAWCDTC